MKLCTSTNLIFERRGEATIPLEHCLALCAEAGFEYLDFGFIEWNLQCRGLRDDNWRELLLTLKASIHAKGLSVLQAHATLYDICRDEGGEALETLHRSIEGAALLGAQVIVVHPTQGNHEKNVQFFRALSEFAGTHSIKLAIENMWGRVRYCVTAEELCRLLDDIDCDQVGACWDAEHGSIENLDQGAAIRLLNHRLFATHISDETGEDNIHVLPYTGRCDWKQVMKALRDIDYQGAFSLEMQHFLPAFPRPLLPAGVKLAYETGAYLVEHEGR